MKTSWHRSRVLAVSTVVSLAGCGAPAAQSDGARFDRSQSAIRVVVEPVAFEADTDRIQAVGTARAKATADIFPETSGEVVAVNFTSGGPVERGQVILRLESRAEELAVRRAEIAVRDAQQLLDRYERIDVPGAISDSQIDTAQTALEAARIDLDLARNSLAERTVRAPFSGYVGLSTVDPGARVTQQTQITRLDDRSVLYVDFAAPEQVFGAIEPGETLSMVPFSAARQTVEATVEAIDSGIDPTTRSFTVRASVDNATDSLRPGMSFRVNFDLPGQRFPSVPETSILWGGDGAYVWTVVDNRAVRAPVDIVSRDRSSVLVRGDLPEGRLIVVEGVQKVRAGSTVDAVVARDAATAPTAGVSRAPGAPELQTP